jgi:hypothetical protein
MALKATGIVISLKSKLLMVGDSVMGCFLQAPGDGDASPARFYKLVPCCSSNKPRSRGNDWPVDPLILSYQLGVSYCPERCPKKETFFG